MTQGCLKLDALWWLKWWNQPRINIPSRCPIQINDDSYRLISDTGNCYSTAIVWSPLCFNHISAISYSIFSFKIHISDRIGSHGGAISFIFVLFFSFSLFCCTCWCITVFYYLNLWGLLGVDETDRRWRTFPLFVVWCCSDGGTNHVCTLLMPRITTSCVAHAVQSNYWAAWWFHGRPVTACSTGMVDGSYIVKHLLKPPLQGVCLSAFACVCCLHGHYCSVSIWMEPSARWRFTTSCEKARWPDICLCGSAGQRQEPRGWRNKNPQVELREWEQRLIRLGVRTRYIKTSERRGFL